MLHGWRGMIEGAFRPLDSHSISGILPRGGTILGTSRTNPYADGRDGTAAVLAAMRTAHPYEEPAFDVLALAPLPGDVGLGRVGSLRSPEPLHQFVSRVQSALPTTSWALPADRSAKKT